MYGTTPCPEILSTRVIAGGGFEQARCVEVGIVVDEGGGVYSSTCPAGHVHTFDADYLPFVTEE